MISNQTAFTAQWPPYPPGFAVDQYSFVEGGIDLAQIYGSVDAVPCFTNFLADTRTSASEDADLKDFALGNVDTCGKVELKKEWVGPAGNVDLKIGTTSAAADVGTGTANGQNGTTGEKTVKPGTYWFTETQGASTSLSDYNSTYSCVDEAGKAQGLPTNVAYGGSFSVPVDTGQDIVCTITNTQKPGTLIVKKVVINDNGGTKVATNFSFKVDGGSSTAFLQDADVLHGKNTLTVAAGSHSVVEADTPIAGYTTTYDNCSNVSVANGATQTCTITNDDVAGHVDREEGRDQRQRWHEGRDELLVQGGRWVVDGVPAGL